MDIREYLFYNKIKTRHFAAKVGVHPQALTPFIHRRSSPSLETAIKIHKATDGQVAYENMVADPEKKAIETEKRKERDARYALKKARNYSKFSKNSTLHDKSEEV